MSFPKLCFRVAGCWGLVSILPLFFLYDLISRKNPPAITHPEYYFGFLFVTFAWQVGFLIIAHDPVRHRPLMFPAMIEKFGYGLSCLVLTAMHLSSRSTALFGVIDLLLGLSFFVAWKMTPSRLGLQ